MIAPSVHPTAGSRPGRTLPVGEAGGLGLAGGTRPAVRALLLAAWLLVAGWLQFLHVPWRDEVRAYSLALRGDTVWAMLRAIHGEGHPALWYLLLRALHAVVGGTAALPVAGFAVGALAAALFAARAPFRPIALVLGLFGAFVLFDYTTIARNYGLSMMLLYLFADRYAAGRDRGVTLGIILLLLCNTNAPSVLLAGGLLLFWATELVATEGWRWSAGKRHLAIAAALTALGALLCLATIYPPYNDAVDAAGSGARIARGWRAAIDLPAGFAMLAAPLRPVPGGMAIFALIVVAAPLGLARRPAGLVAGVAGFLLLGGFFTFVFPGFYRHQALYLVYLLTLYWLVAAGRGGTWRGGSWRAVARLEQGGTLAMTVLLALQLALGFLMALDLARGGVFSRSRDLAALLRRPALARAVVIADPDTLLEPLPYYVRNPLWFVRERRQGDVVAFTRAAKRTVTLGEMLATARALAARTGRPVVIVLREQIDRGDGPLVADQGYLGGFTASRAQIDAFLSATTRLARFAPAQTDESYDVYVLRPPVTAS